MSSKHKTTAAMEEAKPALVPKLRFPEFRGGEGWTQSVLVAACDMQAGKFVSASNISERRKEGLFPCYGGNGLRGYTETHTHNGTYPLIGRQGALCGNVRLVSEQFHATEHAVVATSKEGIDVGWLYYSLDLLNLNRFATGQAQPGLSVDVLENVSLAIPLLETEQQKIAECLRSVDELMAAQAWKVDALKTHKKGLMQQLFPCEGETQPLLRFSNVGDWAMSSLPEVAFFQEGPGIMAIDFHAEGVPLVRLAGVSGSVVTLDGCNYLDPAKVAQKWAHFRLAVNDLVISTSATFGLSSLVTEAAAGAIFYTGLIRFRPSSERLDRGYLETFLGSPHFARQAETAAVGGGIKHFGPSHLKQMNIPIPPLREQQRIAECLLSLDARITAESQNLETLKTHKKGLMQQLFPSAEDVVA